MIPIICDVCLARFEVDASAAGTTVFCPKCGAKNGVPAADSTAGAHRVEPPSGAFAPAKAAAASNGGEETLLHVHPAMFRARPALFSGLIILALGGVAGGIYLFTQSHNSWGIACLVASLGGWGPLAVWKVANMATALDITNKRTIASRGLLSKATTEVLHKDIKNFQVDQTFLNRVLGIGTLGISSSGQDGVEIFVKNLPRPYRIREIIDSHRKL